jgi:hypothetical protein
LKRTLPIVLSLAGVCFAQGAPAQVSPDDGRTDFTEVFQRLLDTGHLRIPGDPLGAGARITPILENGSITNLRLDSPGERYCKAPEIRLEGDAQAAAEIDANCRISAIRVISGGSGYTTPPRIFITPHPRCYRVSQLRIPIGALVEGDGFSSCLIPGDATKPLLFSEGASGFHLRNFAVEGRRLSDVGMQFNGGLTDDAARSTLEGIVITGFRQKNIELNKSYGFVFTNVHSAGSGGWGLYLRDGYNNATQIISGEYSGNSIGGVYVGSRSILFHFSSIAEANGKYGIYYRGPSHGILIDNAYFEANGSEGKGWDLRGEYNNYDEPTRGLTVRNTLFNSAHAEGAAFLENTVDIELSHNTGMPPMLGMPFTANSLRIGKGSGMLRVDGNTSLSVANTAGTPIHREIPPGTQSLFTSELPSRIALPPGSGAANITTVSRKVAVPSGHMVGAGVWMRTDTGTASAWVEVADTVASYTGTLINQPHRQTIGPDWQWVSMNVATDADAKLKTTNVNFRLYRNDGSETKAIYFRAPIAWRDIAGTPARKTIQSFSATPSETRRTNTSEGHSATLPSKP